MQRRTGVWHGAVGGLIAGLVVAAWFLTVDLLKGSPFLTPVTLGSTVFHEEFVYPSARLVFLYSLLHFAAFAFLGAVWVGFLRAIGAQPSAWLGVIFGVLVLNSFHYTALLLGGATALVALPPIHVVLANFAGGIAFMVYLHRTSHSEARFGVETLRDYPLLVRGFLVGIIGALAVAAWFLTVDTLAGRPFLTPAALGSLLFFGAEGPAEIRMNPAVIAAYTVVHLGIFALIGVIFVAVAERVREVPGRWLLFVLALVTLEALLLGTMGALGVWVLPTLGLWAVLVGNFIGIAAMGAVLWTRYPELRALMHQRVETAV